MTTWQSNDDVRRNGGAEVAEFDDAPPANDRPRDDARSERGDESTDDDTESQTPERHTSSWPEAS